MPNNLRIFELWFISLLTGIGLVIAVVLGDKHGTEIGRKLSDKPSIEAVETNP